MTRLFVLLIAMIAVTIAGCENSGRRHSGADTGSASRDADTSPKADWGNEGDDNTDGTVSVDGTVDGTSDGTSDGVVTDGSEGTDDTDGVDGTVFKCPEVDLPYQMRSRLTGKIGTLTRIEVDGKCGVHFVCRFAADYWGDDSPFSTEPDVFGGVLTLSRESDGTWKYVDSLAGEKYAEVYDPI